MSDLAYIKTKKKELCYGCGACKMVCPFQAIDLITDEAGFLYPYVDRGRCKSCGLCNKVCPNNYSLSASSWKGALAGVHKDTDIFKESASGGAFSSLSLIWGNGTSYIVGAAFDSNFYVAHDIIYYPEGIEPLRCSKYVLSDMSNVFIKVKDLLEQDQYVLFSGTPCQIAAIKKYLNKDYKKLLCIDIICHGAPSWKIFREYLNWREAKERSILTRFRFRSKLQRKGRVNTRSAHLEFKNGHKKYVTASNDPYLRAYYMRYGYRPSCYNCRFSCKNRTSDITIGDAWGIEKINMEFHSDNGVSCIIFNSEKGASLKTALQNEMCLMDIDLKFLCENNQNLMKHTKKPVNNDKYLNEILSNEKDFACAVANNTSTKFVKKIGFVIKCNM